MSDLSVEAAKARIAELRAQLKAAEKAVPRERKLTCRVSEKGALSIYGFGRWPVTLYASQFELLRDKFAEVESFYEAHKSEFVRKADD